MPIDTEWRRHHHEVFTVAVRQIHPRHRRRLFMAGIVDGGQGTFSAVLELNALPFSTQPTNFVWTTDVSDATITPSSDTQSAVISVPAGETATTITVTASTTDPNGNPVSGSVTVPLNAPQVFTVRVTQTA